MKSVFLLVALLAASMASAKQPDCSGPDNWAAKMAFVHLKNAGLTDSSKVDFGKTKVTLLASEQIGKGLYQQVHRVVFTEKSGSTIDVITNNKASIEECSMSGVDVYVVSRHLGGTP